MAPVWRICKRFLSCLLVGGMVGCAQSFSLPPAPVTDGVPKPFNSSDTNALNSFSGPAGTNPFGAELSLLPSTSYDSITGSNPWKPTAQERSWKFIVLHHTAAEQGDVDSIHQTHLKRKDASGRPWIGIAYHFVIGNGKGMADGEIEPTFRWKQQLQGAHAGAPNPDYNQKGIGIVLVGNFEKKTPTKNQLQSVKRLVRSLAKSYKISNSNIIGHKEIRATECPGTLFPLQEVVAEVDSPYQFSPDGGSVTLPPQIAQQKAASWR